MAQCCTRNCSESLCTVPYTTGVTTMLGSLHTKATWTNHGVYKFAWNMYYGWMESCHFSVIKNYDFESWTRREACCQFRPAGLFFFSLSRALILIMRQTILESVYNWTLQNLKKNERKPKTWTWLSSINMIMKKSMISNMY